MIGQWICAGACQLKLRAPCSNINAPLPDQPTHTVQRKQVLVQSVADKKLNSNDAIITVIMPGGLLYAGYKKVRYEQAKNELARVSADIEEFSGDILAMQPRSASVAIVARQP